VGFSVVGRNEKSSWKEGNFDSIKMNAIWGRKEKVNGWKVLGKIWFGGGIENGTKLSKWNEKSRATQQRRRN